MMKSLKWLQLSGLLLLFACQQLDQPGNLVPKTVDQDPSIPSITVNGRKLHAEAFGPADSTLIVCLHGGPGADYRYMLRAKSFANHGYRVVFYDQIGSGLSQRFDEDYYTNKDVNAIFMEELRGVIAHYKTAPDQQVILLGHSWGAILATAYAGKYPNEITGMVAIEPGGLKWEDIVTYISNSQSLPLWSEMISDIAYKDLFISDRKNNHEILDYKMLLTASHGNPNTNETITGEAGFWRFGAVVNYSSFLIGERLKPDLSAGIDQFQRPVLFIYGGAGKVYTDEWANRISAPYPNKELFRIEGVGHSGMLDETTWNTVTEPKLITFFQSL